ncbi:hypothetical protein, partial [Pectobacterium versatile]
SFSMNGRSVARIKYLLRQITLAESQSLVKQLLNAQSATEVRQWAAIFMEERGLGGLIRGGR